MALGGHTERATGPDGREHAKYDAKDYDGARTSYLALLLEYPAALGHLVRLADASPWIATFLARHPVLLTPTLAGPPIPTGALQPTARERRALDLTHSNIVRFYDFVENDTTAAISMCKQARP